jgi:alpha-1,2-mannosyltransferase
MINDITTKRKKFNNSSRIADSAILSHGKLYYYKLLIYLYELMGRNVDFAWANSSWTANHMKQLWTNWSGQGGNAEINKLYPPCNLKSFGEITDEFRENRIVSFAQFRPEKKQAEQLEIFKELVQRNPGANLKFVRF